MLDINQISAGATIEGGLYLNKNEQYEYSVLVDFQEGRKSRKQVALILGISERSVSRRVAKHRKNGIHGIKHGNTGKTPSNKKHGYMKVEKMEMIRTKYFDFNVLHLHEELMSQGYQISYMTLLNWCKEEDLAKFKRIFRFTFNAETLISLILAVSHSR